MPLGLAPGLQALYETACQQKNVTQLPEAVPESLPAEEVKHLDGLIYVFCASHLNNARDE